MKSLLAELKRRGVIRVGIAWLALSWLLVAMCALLFPAMGLPIGAVRWLILGLLLASIPVLFLAWRRGLTAARDEAQSAAEAAHNSGIARRIDQMTVVLVLAALSLSLLRQFISEHGANQPDRPAPVVQAVTSTSPEPIDPHSLAVLPFANMSPDPANAYFADGLTEDLLNVLARIEGLKVISRTSSFAFRDSTLPNAEIAARLGVANTLQGAVRRQGEQVRISVQLIEAKSESQLWSQTYDRKLVDIFRVQEEISQAIADALAESLGVRQIKVASSTDDLQAYELFLRGRQLFAQRGANLPAARELLEQAVARDPRYADAWAILASTWYVWRSYALEPDGVSTLERAQAAASQALSIDPSHPGALAVSARLAADAGDRLRHAELIAQALSLEPNNANTWLWKGLGEFEVGHIRHAHTSFQQAQRLDPVSGIQLGWLGISEAMLGNRDQARSMLAQSHALGWRGPAARALFLLELGQQEDGDISQAYLNWLHDDDGMPPAQRDLGRSLAPGLADSTRREEMQDRLLQAAAAQPELDWSILLDVFGLTDAAMAHAQRVQASRAQALVLSLWFPRFQMFREHPDFMPFAEQHGMTAYWRQHGAPDNCTLQPGPPSRLDCSL